MLNKRVTGQVACLLLSVILSLTAYAADKGGAAGDKRPNILLIVAEDMSLKVGAFGDQVAQTPAIDALAEQGIRYPNAFTAAGVCAPSRSALITGVYPISMGTQHMRTGFGIPGTEVKSYEAVPPVDVKAFPELLRRAGYATANFAKKDYQFGEPFTVWDVDVGNFLSPVEPALWRYLPKGKPFFAMVNLMSTHESRLVPPGEKFENRFAGMMEKIQEIRAKNVAQVTDPADVRVPPYYPDTARVRGSIAQHYDNIHYMDSEVARILAALKSDGLEDNTIVIWTTDHGDALPRAKRAIYDSGLKVPMVVRFPDGRDKGKVRDELVSFVDLAPTILTLAGAEVPGFIQGRNFLGEGERQYIFGARDRMDEVPDRVRSVRDDRYEYVRTYLTEEPYFRPIYFRDMFPIMQELWAGEKNHSLEPQQQFYFDAPRPVEELYDTQADPDEVHNLASDESYAEIKQRLSAAMDQWLADVGDLGEKSELEMVEGMWPGLKQPVTAAPGVNLKRKSHGAARVTLADATPGASIGYRIEKSAKESDDGKDKQWSLYTGPFTLAAGETLSTKAIRYGYQESQVTRVTLD